MDPSTINYSKSKIAIDSSHDNCIEKLKTKLIDIDVDDQKDCVK